MLQANQAADMSLAGAEESPSEIQSKWPTHRITSQINGYVKSLSFGVVCSTTKANSPPFNLKLNAYMVLQY